MRVASRNVRSEAISRRTHKEQEVKDTVSTIQLNCSLTLLGLYIEYSGRGVIAFFFLRNKHSEQKPHVSLSELQELVMDREAW